MDVNSPSRGKELNPQRALVELANSGWLSFSLLYVEFALCIPCSGRILDGLFERDSGLLDRLVVVMQYSLGPDYTSVGSAKVEQSGITIMFGRPLVLDFETSDDIRRIHYVPRTTNYFTVNDTMSAGTKTAFVGIRTSFSLAAKHHNQIPSFTSIRQPSIELLLSSISTAIPLANGCRIQHLPT